MYWNIGCSHVTTLEPKTKLVRYIIIIVSKLLHKPLLNIEHHYFAILWTLFSWSLLRSVWFWDYLCFFIYLAFLTNASVTVTAGWHNILKDNFISRVMQHLTTHVNFEFPHWHDIVKASFAPITKNCTSIVNSTMIVSISVICMSLPRRNLSPSMLVSVTPSQAPLLAPILAPCWQANPSSLSLITLPLRAPLRGINIGSVLLWSLCITGNKIAISKLKRGTSKQKHWRAQYRITIAAKVARLSLLMLWVSTLEQYWHW